MKVKIALAFIVGIAVGIGGFWSVGKYVTKTNAPAVSQAQQVQVKDLIKNVGKLVMIPTGEDPVIATINDAAGLISQQQFYKGSQNGDVVLIYQKAIKAIIYSPARNIIVNIGPFVLQDQQSTTTPASTATGTKKN